jgi:hypothetical protein
LVFFSVGLCVGKKLNVLFVRLVFQLAGNTKLSGVAGVAAMNVKRLLFFDRGSLMPLCRF